MFYLVIDQHRCPKIIYERNLDCLFINELRILKRKFQKQYRERHGGTPTAIETRQISGNTRHPSAATTACQRYWGRVGGSSPRVNTSPHSPTLHSWRSPPLALARFHGCPQPLLSVVGEFCAHCSCNGRVDLRSCHI